MTSRLFIACAFAAFTASPVAGSDCIRDQYGKPYCSRAGGGVAHDRYGSVVCGIGYCAVNDEGRVKCSSIPAGGATTDSYGKVRCAGGCQDASPKLCEEPTGAR